MTSAGSGKPGQCCHTPTDMGRTGLYGDSCTPRKKRQLIMRIRDYGQNAGLERIQSSEGG